MKLIFLTNNDITKTLIYWLKEYANEEVIVLESRLSKDEVLYYKPELIISYSYKYIIKDDVLNIMNRKIINLHISLLPWNRGAHPNLWSFLDNTPKGVTIHLIDRGIDTGDILLQKEIKIDEMRETLRSSYVILHKEIQQLFMDNWNKIKNFQIVPKPQPNGGSVHYKKDFEKIRYILGNEGWDIPIFELKRRFKNIKEVLNGNKNSEQNN